jgi:HEAT repeat protein
MDRLARLFGIGRLRAAAAILPTPDFFPDPYHRSEDDVRRLLDRICRYVSVDPGRLDLELFGGDPDGPREAVGYYVPGKREKILIERSQLQDPMALVATLAHEVAHALLLGDGKIRDDDPDSEYLTDLLTVFLGLGVFGANSVIREGYERVQNWYAWSIGKQGYLSERLYGYALALFAWIRSEAKPEWLSHLRLNVQAVCKQSLAYLVKTGDTQFGVKNEGEGTAACLARCVTALQAPSSGARLAALWDLTALGNRAEAAVPALARILKDAEPSLQAAAAEALGAVGPATEAAVSDLLEAALQDGNEGLCRSAVRALGQIGRRPESVVPTLLDLLARGEPDLQLIAVEALGAFGPAAAAAVPALAAVLEDADDNLAGEAAWALARLGEAGRPAIPDLVRALKSGEGVLPVKAAFALGEIGAGVEEVVPALRRALGSSDDEVREEAEAALRKIDSRAVPPDITRFLE